MPDFTEYAAKCNIGSWRRFVETHYIYAMLTNLSVGYHEHCLIQVREKTDDYIDDKYSLLYKTCALSLS